MNRIAMFLSSAVLLAGSAFAQDVIPQPPPTFAFTQDGQTKPPSSFNFSFTVQNDKAFKDDIAILGAEMAATGEVVASAPYTATATTEVTQTLGDGNRIVNKTSSFVARDSQGRTRREDSVGRIGPMQVNNLKMVFINDPTTHTEYVLQPNGESTKVVRSETSWGAEPQIIELANNNGQAGMKRKMIFKGLSSERHQDKEGPDQVKHEDLGMQTIEGVSAEGKRDTVTIPAGQIGNERPIEVVSETWFSPELHTTILRKHSDPRVGETVFRLTEIKRNEPDASLFQAPAGAKTLTEPLIELKRMLNPDKE
jgi:hypothetical protein